MDFQEEVGLHKKLSLLAAAYAHIVGMPVEIIPLEQPWHYRVHALGMEGQLDRECPLEELAGVVGIVLDELGFREQVEQAQVENVVARVFATLAQQQERGAL
jgi:hypothetical protein